jgi:peptidylprolyl isomerase
VVKPLTSNKLLRIAAAAMALTLLAGACSSDDEGESSTGSETAGERHEGAPPVPDSCDSPDEDAQGAEQGAPAQDDGASGQEADPEVVASIEERGQPDPAAVVAEVGGATEPVDLVAGTGDAVVPAGTVEVHYSVINPGDNSELESSWAMGEVVPIPLGQVFPAFGESMDGMLVGGRRAFVIPATDVVGDPPPPESGLTAQDNVLFVVDLVSVSEGVPEQDGAVEPNENAQKAADDRGAPEMSVPEGDAETTELIWIDDVVGDGDVVCPGDSVLAHYTGIQASDGEEFDSSWERGEPIEFGLDGVIKGWTDGLVGMKVGGRRTLVIPADQAYGEEASGGGPSGVLVFTIDLIGVS